MTTTRSTRPTITDVARTAGVSTATVSRVINGAPTVDKELSRRVQAAVRSTGYVPSALGRSLRRGGTSQIAVVAPDAENPYFVQIISEVERIARGQNHSVSVSHTEDDLEVERRSIEQLVSRQVSGVVVVPVSSTETDLSPLISAGIPVVPTLLQVARFDARGRRWTWSPPTTATPAARPLSTCSTRASGGRR